MDEDDRGLEVETMRLSSSWMLSASYNHKTQDLTVRFQNGSAYVLPGVPPDIAQGLFEASSPGQYWNQYLKGQY